jgi:hypothetical protein
VLQRYQTGLTTLGGAEYHGNCPRSGSHTRSANLRVAQRLTHLLYQQPLKEPLHIHSTHHHPQSNSQPWTVSALSIGRCVFNPLANLSWEGCMRAGRVGHSAFTPLLNTLQKQCVKAGYFGRCIYITLADLSQKESMRLHCVGRCIFTYTNNPF